MNDNKKNGVGLDADLVRELANILRDSGLNELEIQQGDLKLKLSRGAVMTTVVAAAPQALPHAHQVAAPAALPPPSGAPEAAPAAVLGHPVPSPMVGTAYLSAEPGAPPFVKVGDTVTEGQTLMVVEAMKTFNPIPSPRAGKVKQILVADAQPVEFGETLITLE